MCSAVDVVPDARRAGEKTPECQRRQIHAQSRADVSDHVEAVAAIVVLHRGGTFGHIENGDWQAALRAPDRFNLPCGLARSQRMQPLPEFRGGRRSRWLCFRSMSLWLLFGTSNGFQIHLNPMCEKYFSLTSPSVFSPIAVAPLA